jgi:tricorn protease
MRMFVILPMLAGAVLAWGEPYLTEPAICPTRPEIAFVSGGDIWMVSAKGGEAHLLVSHPADESRPLYSPDGSQLAFVSTRTGNGDIYLLTLATGGLKRLTFDDGLDQLDGWSRDGRWLYFSSGSHDVNRKNDIYRVSVEGGTPMAVSADRFTNEFEAAPAPDGTTIAFAARGVSDQQWWRRGYSHLDESEIWLRKEGASANYERVVEMHGRNVWPMWTPDGRQLYFMSDRSGQQNIWTVALGGKPRQVTKFTGGRVLWPSISYDGKSIVFEHDFKIWQLDTKSGEAYKVPITLVGSAAGPGVTHMALNQFTDLRLSPDAKKIAMIAHGHVFAAPARDGGEAVRLTSTPGAESQVVWAPDSTRIAYLSQRDAITHVFVYDFAKHSEAQLTSGPVSDQNPRFSPDGKSLAFVRGFRQVFLSDLDNKKERLLVTGFIGDGFGPSDAFSWSLDGKWIAYASDGEQGLRNLFVVPVTGTAGRQISFLANANTDAIQWSPDGKYLLYMTGQRTEMPQVARIDLVPHQPKFNEERFEDLFKPEEAKPAKETKPVAKAVEINFDGIRERVSLLPIGLAVSSPQISPDGKSLLVTAGVAGQTNLYLYPLEETSSTEPRVAKQLTSTPGAKRSAQFSPDSKEVFYLEAGKIQTINIETRVSKPVAVNAEMDVNFDQEKMAVFEQAWAGQRDGFYDPKFHGADWNAVRQTYAPLIEAARTPDEERRILRLMIGELNSSHSGVSAPSNGPPHPVVGQLGLSFDRAEYENSGKLRVSSVLPHSPAAIAGIHVSDELRAVDGVLLSAHVNLDELLQHKVDKRVVLDVSGRQITLRPVGSIADLIYRQWVEENRTYVTRISNGKLGYVHMRDMSEQALAQLYFDLDSENRAKQGVVIDIRNNNGGFVNVYALDVLARRPYLTMTTRNGPAAQARTQLGQRSLELPTILVVNQHSLSDAEDFTEGYKTLKLGKVVGEPTAGWIIFTGGMELIDGSTMRMPGTKIAGADGKEMENNPRTVDIAVTRPIGESYTGRDSQLDAAAKELLAEIGK